MKPTTKSERTALKASERSKRNTRNRNLTTSAQRRKERRKDLRQGTRPAVEVSTTTPESSVTLTELQAMKVADLRDLCTERGIKTTTKTRKGELIEMLGFRNG